jgi:hypothetical protein
VSLKDQFHVKGVETSMGYVGWLGTFEGNKDDPRKGVYESEMVRELRNLGAILYCKTSVPHTLMSVCIAAESYMDANMRESGLARRSTTSSNTRGIPRIATLRLGVALAEKVLLSL